MLAHLGTNDAPTACIEGGTWTAVPRQPPVSLEQYTLTLEAVAPLENSRIIAEDVMTLHMVGCSGDFSGHRPEDGVVAAMVAQVITPGSVGCANSPARQASFLFHLGDVVYTDAKKADTDGKDQGKMYRHQFYKPFTGYNSSIFAIAGNHDGKDAPEADQSAITHFLLNFCATSSGISPDNTVDNRQAMMQPYVYWRLETPFAYIIGLYANVANGGVLDDPNGDSPVQHNWLVRQLTDVQQRNGHNTPRKAVLLAVHYPPYSGAMNFQQRGNPLLVRTESPENGAAEEVTTLTAAPTPEAIGVRPLATWLEEAFQASTQYPDAVFAAHAHLYQRLTSTYADGRQIPYLIVGAGGHQPVENMWEHCDHSPGTAQTVPFPAVLPADLKLLPGQSVEVEAFADQSTGGHFGFLRLTIVPGQPGRRVGEFFTAYPGSLTLADSFTLDMDTHQVTSPAMGTST